MSLRVVIVLARRSFREATEEALRRAGFDVTAMGSSIPAWQIVKQCDVLVTDIKLPAGQPSGIALARGGQFANPRLRMLFLVAGPHEAKYVNAGDIMPAGTSPEAIAAYVARIEWWRTAPRRCSLQRAPKAA